MALTIPISEDLRLKAVWAMLIEVFPGIRDLSEKLAQLTGWQVDAILACQSWMDKWAELIVDEERLRGVYDKIMKDRNGAFLSARDRMAFTI